MKSEPSEVIKLLSQFSGADLTQTLSRIENAVVGVTVENCSTFLSNSGAAREALAAAAEMKRLAGQINLTIHALGILLCLPHILRPGERVEYVSLGAGNTGRPFDLQTNRRVAEFKFIRWRGGAETIRQNGIFKDFFSLQNSENPRPKYLYLLGTKHALKFLTGGRSLGSVMSRDEKVRQLFFDRFGDRFKTVRDYYQAFGDAVLIEDVSPWLSELVETLITEADDVL